MRNGRFRSNGGPQLTWPNIALALGLIGGVLSAQWIIFQNQFGSLEQQVRQSVTDINGQIKDNRTEVDRLRDRTVSTSDIKEVVKRLDEQLNALQRRLDVIETTRPTTGELQSAASSIKDQIGEIKERLRFLEQVPVLRAPPTPPAHS